MATSKSTVIRVRMPNQMVADLKAVAQLRQSNINALVKSYVEKGIENEFQSDSA